VVLKHSNDPSAYPRISAVDDATRRILQRMLGLYDPGFEDGPRITQIRREHIASVVHNVNKQLANRECIRCRLGDHLSVQAAAPHAPGRRSTRLTTAEAGPGQILGQRQFAAMSSGIASTTPATLHPADHVGSSHARISSSASHFDHNDAGSDHHHSVLLRLVSRCLCRPSAGRLGYSAGRGPR
jgi:hypothetical protein